MTEFPAWMLNPDDENAPAAMAADLAELIGRKKLAEIAERDPDVNLETMANHPRLQAEIEAEVIRLTAKNVALGNRSLAHQSIKMVQRGVWQYHPSEPANAAEHFQSLLDGVDRESSTWYDLYFLATKMYPFMVAQCIQGAEELYREGNIGKIRASIPHLRRLMAQLEQPVTESIDSPTNESDDGAMTPMLAIREILAEVKDPLIDVSQFQARHVGRSRSDLAQISGWNYVQPSGGVLVLMYTDEAQLHYMQTAMGNKVDWSLGTGKEPILGVLHKLS